jgi:hypothetical protein
VLHAEPLEAAAGETAFQRTAEEEGHSLTVQISTMGFSACRLMSAIRTVAGE